MKLKKPSKKLIVAAACSLALVGAIGLVGCGGSQQSAPEQRQESAEIHGGIVFCFR